MSRYGEVLPKAEALLDGCPDFLSGMASLAALLKQEIPEFFWVGFYLPREDGALIVGPYQGPLACILLPAGRGVCGASAKSRETILVPDVHAFPDHIACSGESRSEIVVPLLRGAELRAVLDVDSVRADEFGEEDQAVLERLAARLASLP